MEIWPTLRRTVYTVLIHGIFTSRIDFARERDRTRNHSRGFWSISCLDVVSSPVEIRGGVKRRFNASHIPRVRAEGSQKVTMHHKVIHETTNEPPATVACVAASVLRNVKMRMLVKKDNMLRDLVSRNSHVQWRKADTYAHIRNAYGRLYRMASGS